MIENKTQIALSDALTNYYKRISMFSGNSRLICTITYLAGHKFFGSEPFINTIVHGGDLPTAFLNRAVAMIDSELKVDFSDEDVENTVKYMAELRSSFSELYYLNALCGHLDVPSEDIFELLSILDFATVIDPVTKKTSMRDMSAGLTVANANKLKNLTIHEVLAGIYVDVKNQSAELEELPF